MAHCRRINHPPLTENLNNHDFSVRGRFRIASAASASSGNNNSHSSGLNENKRFVSNQMTELLDQAGAGCEREQNQPAGNVQCGSRNDVCARGLL